MIEPIIFAAAEPINLLCASAPPPLSDTDAPLEPSATASDTATEVASMVAVDFALTVTVPMRSVPDPS